MVNSGSLLNKFVPLAEAITHDNDVKDKPLSKRGYFFMQGVF